MAKNCGHHECGNIAGCLREPDTLVADQDDADREAAELLPCSFRETDCPGNDPYSHFDCPHPYRPAVAAKLRAKELYGSQGWDRWHKALDRIAVLEADVTHWRQLCGEATQRRIEESKRVQALEAERDALRAEIKKAKANACHGDWPCEASTEAVSLESELIFLQASEERLAKVLLRFTQAKLPPMNDQKVYILACTAELFDDAKAALAQRPKP